MSPGRAESRKNAGLAEPTSAIASAIEEIRRSGTPLHRLAKEAGIAPARIIEIRSGAFVGREGEKEKAIVGRAQTLARLTLHANEWLKANNRSELKLDRVLAEFGISASRPEVGRAITKVREQAGVHRHVSDPVLRQIALRKNVVNIGVLKWRPFYSEEDSSAAASWAGDYSKRLAGSINPGDWELSEPEAIRDINAAVTALGSGSSKFDMIFGVFSTLDKRLKGLEFLPLPGIAMPLSFVCAGDAVSWEKIIEPDEKFRKEMQALVLKGEVGELFLLGACQFSKKANLEREETFDVEELVKLFFGLIRRRPSAPIFFCADRTMCRSFLDVAKRVATTDKVLLEVIDRLKISDPDPAAPKYRMGVAVRADATAWLDLLRYAQRDELFQNALGQMARAYVALLERAFVPGTRDAGPTSDIELIPLTPDLPMPLAKRFANRCRTLLADEVMHAYDRQMDVWLSSLSDGV